jgi:Tfp pilus assembly protein PilX
VSRPTRLRLAGDDGAGLVVGIVLIFAFTFLGLVWLARDVDRGVSNRSTAQSIAFQAARSGAQANEISRLRDAGEVVAVDEGAARQRAAATAAELFASYGVDGAVTSIDVGVDHVSVTVEIVDGGIRVTGSGTARTVRAP